MTIVKASDINGVVNDMDRTRRRVDIPEYVVVAEMDRARKVAEDAIRVHDVLAAELGYERVRVEAVEPGDVLVRHHLNEVTSREVQVEGDSGFHHWAVTYTDGHSETFMPGEFVSRQLPIFADEPF